MSAPSNLSLSAFLDLLKKTDGNGNNVLFVKYWNLNGTRNPAKFRFMEEQNKLRIDVIHGPRGSKIIPITQLDQTSLTIESYGKEIIHLRYPCNLSDWETLVKNANSDQIMEMNAMEPEDITKSNEAHAEHGVAAGEHPHEMLFVFLRTPRGTSSESWRFSFMIADHKHHLGQFNHTGNGGGGRD